MRRKTSGRSSLQLDIGRLQWNVPSLPDSIMSFLFSCEYRDPRPARKKKTKPQAANEKDE